MKNYSDNPTRVAGFTLVEMLVVILILLLLVGIAIPAFTGVVQAIHQGQSQSIINQLDGAVRAYQMDFATSPTSPGADPNGLPPSTYVDPNHNTWYGCQAIVLFLTGYHDANGIYGGTPSVGFGWHPNRNSPTYGPYNDSDKTKVLPSGDATGYTKASVTVPQTTVWDYKTNDWAKDASGNLIYVDCPFTLYNDVSNAITDSGGHVSHPVFLDAFGQPITYYSTNNATHTYATTGSGALADNYCNDGVHNNVMDSTQYPGSNSTTHTGSSCIGNGIYYHREDHTDTGLQHTGPGMDQTRSTWGSDLYAMFGPAPYSATGASYTTNPSGVPYRSDFMLMSWGGDQQWYSGAAGSTTIKDDANNLYGK